MFAGVYRLFETAINPFKTGPMLSRNLVNKYQHMVRNIPEERRLQPHRGGSLKSRKARTRMSEILLTFQRVLPYVSVLN